MENVINVVIHCQNIFKLIIKMAIRLTMVLAIYRHYVEHVMQKNQAKRMRDEIEKEPTELRPFLEVQ